MIVNWAVRSPLAIDPSSAALEIECVSTSCDQIGDSIWRIWNRIDIPADSDITQTLNDNHFFGLRPKLEDNLCLISFDGWGRLYRLWRYADSSGWTPYEIPDEEKGKCDLRPYSRVLFKDVESVLSFSILMKDFVKARESGDADTLRVVAKQLVEVIYFGAIAQAATGIVATAMQVPEKTTSESPPA